MTTEMRSGLDPALATVDLTEDLTDTEREVLLAIAERRELGDGELLLEEGHRDSCMYLITAGELSVRKASGQGDEQVISLLKPGDFTGAMGCLDGLAHCATLRATRKAEVYGIERQRFESLVETHPWLVYKVMRSIVRTLHNIVGHMNTNHVEMINYINKLHGRY
jgi:CRP/FNR family cyclic AMP-dependent transcriptional regulator